ncbi:hypothetical protein UXO11_22420 [Enterobacter wuhouensis]|uniref:hypothetical protein n=1 Tax=Enterobacter wuhouensis TaxID=2529381 RepID=UPI002FCFEEE3
MLNIHVKSWEDWETFCKYWMADIAKTIYLVTTSYQSYGRSGQKQHGVDLKPEKIGCGIVGQCKFIKGAFTLKDLKAELIKTNDYPGPITAYYILTTAQKCTSVQNEFSFKSVTHTRPNGTSFHVGILYWSELEKLNFLPPEVKHNLFPEVKHLFGTETEQHTDSISINPEERLIKLGKLKALLKKTFSEDNITWLETNNFRTYEIRGTDYDAFSMPYLQWDWVVMALRNNNEKLLSLSLGKESNIEFYATWPASERLFEALREFRKVAYNNYNTSRLVGNETYLTIADLKKNRDSIASQMESAASYLAQVIRDIQN